MPSISDKDYELDSRDFFRKVTGEDPDSYLNQMGGNIDEEIQVITNLDGPIDVNREEINVPVLYKTKYGWEPGFIKNFLTSEDMILAHIYGLDNRIKEASLWYNFDKNIPPYNYYDKTRVAYTKKGTDFNRLWEKAQYNPLSESSMKVLNLKSIPENIQNPEQYLE